MWPFKKKKSVNQNNRIDQDFGYRLWRLERNFCKYEELRKEFEESLEKTKLRVDAEQHRSSKMDNNMRSFIMEVANDTVRLTGAVLKLEEKSELIEKALTVLFGRVNNHEQKTDSLQKQIKVMQKLLEELTNEASNKKSKSRTKHKNTRRNAAVGTKSTGTKSAN